MYSVSDPFCLSQTNILFFFSFFKYLFIYSWLCWVFVSARGPSPVVASGDHSSSQCAGLSLSRPLPLRSTGSRRAGSAIVAHGPSRSAACGILPDQGSNPCPLHWQADSQPLRHQGSPNQHSLKVLTVFGAIQNAVERETRPSWKLQSKGNLRFRGGMFCQMTCLPPLLWR